MKNIARKLIAQQIQQLNSQEVILIFGARRVGKTHFIKEYLKELGEPYIYFNGEDIQTHSLLAEQSVANYKSLIGEHKLLYLDEAQKILNIGAKLKLMVDEIEGLRIIVSGSSSFDILQQVGEPLTGRKKTIQLYPFSEEELNSYTKPAERQQFLEQRLVYGAYPHLIHLSNLNDKKSYLNDMLNSYLLKDILAYENVKNANKIYSLLKLIAFQIGGEVSLQELGKQLGISKNTVDKYLDLLCKMFILHRVDGFSRNLRKEITKSSKWYFIDNGIRNAVISNFNPISLRNDIGQLWENYVIAERLKYKEYHQVFGANYFWRTYDQQEIDWVEERDGNLFGYELKYSTTKAKVPPQWKKGYPEAEFKVITKANYKEWIG